jgi:hypothetical protein
MAYALNIKIKCRCGRQATKEVFNNQNSSVGKFCKDCAEKRVQYLNGLQRTKIIGCLDEHGNYKF